MIPALIKKCVDAGESDAPEIPVWGAGSATHEFIYVEDAGEDIVPAAEWYDGAEPVKPGRRPGDRDPAGQGVLGESRGLPVGRTACRSAPLARYSAGLSLVYAEAAQDPEFQADNEAILRDFAALEAKRTGRSSERPGNGTLLGASRPRVGRAQAWR